MIRKIISIVGKTITGVVIVIALILVTIYLYNTSFIETENPMSVAPTNTKFIDINNEKLAYSEINNNSSTSIIFVGGLSAWNGTWERVIQSLDDTSKEYNYIALDLPPFGYSIPDNQKLYFRDIQADRLKQFIENKKLNQVILVGHSYGAGPVTEYVLNNPNRVQKLILISAVLNIDTPKIVPRFSLIKFDILRNILIGDLIHNDAFALSQLKKFVQVQDHMDQALLDNYTKYFNTNQTSTRLSSWLQDYSNDPLNYKSNYSENYKEISVPVRLIWGNMDTVTPISGTKIIMDSVPDIQLTTLTNIGHIPMIEDYQLFDSALLKALKK